MRILLFIRTLPEDFHPKRSCKRRMTRNSCQWKIGLGGLDCYFYLRLQSGPDIIIMNFINDQNYWLTLYLWAENSSPVWISRSVALKKIFLGWLAEWNGRWLSITSEIKLFDTVDLKGGTWIRQPRHKCAQPGRLRLRQKYLDIKMDFKFWL